MSQQFVKPKQIAAGTNGDMLETLAGVTTWTPFAEAVDDRVAALLVAGTNITLTYNDPSNTLTIDATSGGGGLTDYTDIMKFGVD